MTDTPEAKTVSVEDYNKQVERAQRFEGQIVDLQKQMERFKGFDPEKAKADADALEQLMKEKGKTDQTTIDELIARKEAEFEKRYGTKYTEQETELSNARSELKRLRVTNVALQKAADIFNPDALELIQSRIESDCDFADGEIIIKGENGKALPSKLDPRKQMDLDEYLQSLAAKYPSTAKSSVAQGSRGQGTKMPAGTGTEITVEQFAAMTEEQRSKLPNDLRGKLSQQYFRK